MKYENQVLTKEILVGRKQIQWDQLRIGRNPYPLEELEFVYLTSWQDWPNDWMKRSLFIAFGLSIPLLGKTLDFMIKFNKASGDGLQNIKINIQGWELWACLIAYILFGVFYFLTKKVETNKTKVKDSISDHFKDA